MYSTSETFKIPIFPNGDWDPTAPSNPVITVYCKRSSKVFDKASTRTIQALLSPLSIAAIEAALNEWFKLEEKSTPKLFELIQNLTADQRKALSEFEDIVEEVRVSNCIPENTVDKWFDLRERMRPADLVPISETEKAEIATLVFTKDRKGETRLFTKMGDLWDEADFKNGRGNWTLNIENFESDRPFNRTRFDRVLNAALLVNIFPEKATRSVNKTTKTRKRKPG